MTNVIIFSIILAVVSSIIPVSNTFNNMDEGGLGQPFGLLNDNCCDDVKSDEYIYDLDSATAFGDINGDEFERVKNAEFAQMSELGYFDEDGNRVVSKAAGTETHVKLRNATSDSFENNDSFGEATNMYGAGTDGNGVFRHWSTVYGTISKKESTARSPLFLATRILTCL